MIKNKETCLKKYGVDSIFKVDYIREKIFDKRKERLINMYAKYNLLDVNYEKYNYICKCEKGHKFEIPKTIFYNRICTDTSLCTICNPIGSSNSDKENDVCDFIFNNCNYNIVKNDRFVINPFELDIYITDLKLAFEFNGLYWHNELYKPNNYHSMKTKMCEDKGIQLIHIYEDDWIYKKDIIKSKILNILDNIENKILSTKTNIIEISDNNIVNDFLNKNHLQGYINSKIKIGLYYEDSLVSLMIFGNIKKDKQHKNDYKSCEMLRFCDKLNTIVIEGYNKIFDYFIDKYDYDEIICYDDKSWSKGEMCYKLGFNFIKNTSPSYCYIINGIKKDRFNFKKNKLIKENINNINKTEHDIMLERKIYRIYDSGNMKFIYKK